MEIGLRMSRMGVRCMGSAGGGAPPSAGEAVTTSGGPTNERSCWPEGGASGERAVRWRGEGGAGRVGNSD